MKFRFNVGDKVRLRSDLKELNRSDYACGLIDDMKKYAGETVTIKDVIVRDDKPCYYIEEYCYAWDERLFDGGQTIDMPTVQISKVIFNNPATIVLWADGTKTVVKKQKEKNNAGFSKRKQGTLHRWLGCGGYHGHFTLQD